MKKLLTLSACATVLMISANTMAFTWPWEKKKEQAESQPTQTVSESDKKTPAKQTLINLYAKPETSADILKKLPVNADFVAIFRKEGWIKVGDREDGKTGWINLKQYHQAKNNLYRQYFHQDTETVYFHTEKDKDGKVKIVGYRNGKKLSGKEADKLYKDIQKQQEHQWREMEHLNRNMDRMMMHMYDEFPHPVIMMPGVVIIDHNSNNANTKKDNPENKKADTKK